MKLTDENGKEYEFESNQDYYKDTPDNYGFLKPIEEWPQEGDITWYIGNYGNIGNYDWYSQSVKEFTGIYKTELEAEQARDRIRSLQEADVWSAFKPTEEDFCKIEMQVPTKYLKAWKALEDKE